MCDRFIGQQPDGILLDPEDSFWCQALEDLETCGQSELLREIEVSEHVTTHLYQQHPLTTWSSIVVTVTNVSSLLCCHANISIKPYQEVCLTFSVYIIAQYQACGASVLLVQVQQWEAQRHTVLCQYITQCYPTNHEAQSDS